MSNPFAHWQKAIQSRDLPPESPPQEDVILPPTFQFSQNSLQDYVDCARRFQLRYVHNQRWPAAESEPIADHERFVEEGSQFHLMVQRYLMGIPVERMVPPAGDLHEWWLNFITNNPLRNLPSTHRHPEIQLSAPLGKERVLARFDLLCVDPGDRAVIVDWKTSRFRPDRQKLAMRLQSRIYPFILAEAGSTLFGSPIAPEQISLIYWFANEPTRTETYTYDSTQHAETRAYLTDLVSRVLAHRDEIWPLTTDERLCHYCVYRSLCNRGITAGDITDIASDLLEPKTDFDFDLDNVDEIAF